MHIAIKIYNHLTNCCRRESLYKYKLSGCVIIIVVCGLFCAPNAFAQWKKLASFSQTVNSVFISDSGKNSNYTAYIGTDGLKINPDLPSNGEAWRTTDGGKMWKKVFTAPSSFIHLVTSFTFKDSLTGWLGAGDFNYGKSNGGGCFKTTDGGDTWINVLPSIYSQQSAAVYYQPYTKLLFFTCTGDYAESSKDEGTTWQEFGSSNQQGFLLTGFTFIDSLNGVVASTGLRRPTYTRNKYYNTYDGGKSWNPLKEFTFSWQPAAFKSSIFAITTPELQDYDTLYRTNDIGRSWQMVYAFPKYFTVVLTVGADSNALYIQTGQVYQFISDQKPNPIHGFFRSKDEGISWEHICGPENHGFTRFFISDYGIWAGDVNGNLFFNRTKKANASRLQIEKDNVSRHRAFIGEEIPIALNYTTEAYYEGVDSLSFVMNYSEAISFVRDSAADGWSVLRREISDTSIRFILKRTVAVIPDTSSLILKAYFKGYVARAKTATLALDEINFNQDTTFRECMTASLKRTDSLFIDLQDGCGDSILRGFLTTGELLQINSIRPNPAQDNVTVELHSAIAHDGTIEIINSLGEELLTRPYRFNSGSNTLHLDMRSFSKGAYLLRIRNATIMVSQSFIKQ